MSTYMPKANEITRKWYVLDAENKPLGRVAAKAATFCAESTNLLLLPMLIAEITLSSSTAAKQF